MVHDDDVDASERKRAEGLALIQESQQLQANGNVEEGHAKMSQAFYCLEKSLELCPGNHRSRFVLVNCAMGLDDYERAKVESLAIYEELSLEQLREMKDAVLHLSIAHAAKMLGQKEETIQFATEATQLYEDDPHPHIILGEMYESLDRDAEAEHECREAIRLGAHNTPHALNQQTLYFAQCCLGAALLKQGKNQEAVNTLHEATTTVETPTLAWRHLCDAYHHQGHMKEALEAAQKVALMDPDNPEIHEKIQTLESDMRKGTNSKGPSRGPSQRGSKPGSRYGSEGGRAVSQAGSMRSRGSFRSNPRLVQSPSRDESALELTVPLSQGKLSARSHQSQANAKDRGDGKLEDRSKKDDSKGGGGGGLCCCIDR